MNKSTDGNLVFLGGRERLSEEVVFRPSSVWTVSSLFAGVISHSHDFAPQPDQEPFSLLNYKDGGQVLRWIPHFPSVPLVLGGLPLHTLLTELPIFFFLAVSIQRGITHIPTEVLKPLRSSEAQSPVEESSFPRNSREKPPGRTSCLSVTGNQSYEKEDDWKGPAVTLEPFLACRRFSSCHRNVQTRSRETACLKRWQFQMAVKSNHNNDSSHLTRCYSNGSCIAASRCQLAGSVWVPQGDRLQAIWKWILKTYCPW